MVLEEGLDMSRLPETLKEDFDQLDRLEGQYRVTSILMEVIDLEDLSPRKGPPCSFCNVKEEAEKMKMIVEHYKPMTTLSKVIQSDCFDTIALGISTLYFETRMRNSIDLFKFYFLITARSFMLTMF